MASQPMRVNPDDPYLTINAAQQVLARMGFSYTTNGVRSMADRGDLPFFRMGRARYIQQSELIASVVRRQQEALRAAQRRRPPG